MQGQNITNIYIIEGKEYLFGELSSAQKELIEKLFDKQRLFIFKSLVIKKFGGDIHAFIKIDLASNNLTTVEQNGNLIFDKNDYVQLETENEVEKYCLKGNSKTILHFPLNFFDKFSKSVYKF